MLDGYQLPDRSQRLPPSNLEAEQRLLGALLANNRNFARCAFLEPRHFADSIHARIFDAARKRIERGDVADPLTLKAQFENSGILKEVGGTAYLMELLTAYVGNVVTESYAHAIRDAWLHREIIAIGDAAAHGAFAAQSPADLLAAISEKVDRLSAGQTVDRAVTLDAAMDAAMDAMDRAQAGATAGISTGFRSFDARLGGLEAGLLYVLAGRPGMGKSSLGYQIALSVARAGHSAIVASLEMSSTQLGRRALATAAGVPINCLKAGQLSNDAAIRLVAARKELSGLPLTIDDAAGQTPGQIVSKVRAARRKHGISLVMIDHINLLRAEESDARHGATWAVERASSAMLEMAKSCECPVLLLAQLNRGVEGRDDKRPVLADLRQAGALEQDAYSVGFVYRPEYYTESEPMPMAGEHPSKTAARIEAWRNQRDAERGRAEVIWRKVRDGEPGTDLLTFDGPTATFSEG